MDDGPAAGHNHTAYAGYASRTAFAAVTAPLASTPAVVFSAFGANVTITRDYASTKDGVLGWEGVDNTSGMSTILIINGTEVFGTVKTAGCTYVISPVSPGVHEVLKLNMSRFPPPGYP